MTIGSFTFDSSSFDNPILSNSIFANGALGIDLGDDGVTPNSPGVKFGPNQLQNFPILVIAANFGSSVVVTGTLECRRPARPIRSSFTGMSWQTLPASARASSCSGHSR